MGFVISFTGVADYMAEIERYSRWQVGRVLRGEVRVDFAMREITTQSSINKPLVKNQLIIQSNHIIIEKNIPILVRAQAPVGLMDPGEKMKPLKEYLIPATYQKGEAVPITAARIVNNLRTLVHNRKLKLIETGFIDQV